MTWATKNAGDENGKHITLVEAPRSSYAWLLFVNTALLLKEVSEKKTQNLKQSYRKCPEIRPDISSALLAGRKVFPPMSPDSSPSDISDFQSNVTKTFHNTLLTLQAWHF